MCAARRGGTFLFFAVCSLLASTAPAQVDVRQATPPSGKAFVYIFRSDREIVAAAIPISANAEPLGELANGTFVMATVNPGRTYLRAGDRVVSTLQLAAASNQSYFVSVQVVPGVMPVRGEMRLVSEAAGRSSLLQSRFAGAAPAIAGAGTFAPQPSSTARSSSAAPVPSIPPRPQAPGVPARATAVPPAAVPESSAAARLRSPSAAPAAAQGAPAQVGTVTHLSGVLVARKTDGGTRLLSVKSAVAEGETLTTEQSTYARVKFEDNAEVVLRPSSQLKIESYQYQNARPERDNVLLSLVKGGLRSVTGLVGRRSRDKVKFGAATATIGIRGTHFGMLLCQNDCAAIASVSGPPANGLHVDVVDGAVTISNRAGQQVLLAGQYGYARDLNTLPAVVPPARGIQVTMPLSISRNAGAGKSIGNTSDLECPVK